MESEPAVGEAVRGGVEPFGGRLDGLAGLEVLGVDPHDDHVVRVEALARRDVGAEVVVERVEPGADARHGEVAGVERLVDRVGVRVGAEFDPS
ncbi:hypothetical protein ACFQL4_10635 [Halosimplex aquaticum]